MGAEYSAVWAEQGECGRCWSAVSRILYRLVAALARLAVRSGRTKDLEIIVLRHQLAVLRRQIDRPALNDADRTLLGAIAGALPCSHRAGWMPHGSGAPTGARNCGSASREVTSRFRPDRAGPFRRPPERTLHD